MTEAKINHPKGALVLCETTAAVTIHLRRLSSAGPKYGGGADTKTLCGMKPSWDLECRNTEIARCKKCREAAGMEPHAQR